jgi:hypothetical protein
MPGADLARYKLGSLGPIELNEAKIGQFTGPGSEFRAATSVVHEAQHILDDARGVLKANLYYEARALIREAQYADSIGMPQLSTFQRTADKYGTSRFRAWQQVKRIYSARYGL